MGSRRGKDEGSIYRRSDGLWVGSLDLGVIDGKRKRKVVYGKTRREVAQKLHELRKQFDAGVNLAAEKQTLSEFLDVWLEQVVKKNNRPNTHRAYSKACRLHIIPHIGHIHLDKLRAQHVQVMLNALAERLSVTTVRHTRTILVTALNQAVRWSYIPRNVAALVDAPAAQPYEAQFLTEEQAERLLAVVQGHRNDPLYRFALGVGLRMGEIIALKWADIDFDQGKLSIKGGKTPNARRTINLPDELLTVLREHWSEQQQERFVHGLGWQEHGLVFPGTRGKPMQESSLREHFKRMLQKAGLPDNVRFHDLRHSCASFLIVQKVHPRVIMKILGHSSITITMNMYGHVFPEQEQEALENLQHRLQSGYKSDSNENNNLSDGV
jgi:integrase